MTYLGQVRVEGGDVGDQPRGEQPVVYKVDVGRTLALLLLGGLSLIAAFVLWMVDKGSAAPYFFALGEAVVVGGFGIAVGEKNGAETAGSQLPAGPA